jgi:hypothetical protein
MIDGAERFHRRLERWSRRRLWIRGGEWPQHERRGRGRQRCLENAANRTIVGVIAGSVAVQLHGAERKTAGKEQDADKTPEESHRREPRFVAAGLPRISEPQAEP